MTDDTTRSSRISRRKLLSTGAASVGVASGIVGVGRAQTPTETDGGGEAQIVRRAVVPRVGEPYEGEYRGQFVQFTDPTPRDDITPEVVGECEFANWAPEETRGYQGMLIDRITDEPRAMEVPLYLNQNRPRIEVGDTRIVNRIEPCTEEFLGLELEAIPVDDFAPEYGPVEHPLVGEEPGPTVSPVDDTVGGEETGQPGFGVIAAVLGVGGAGLLRRLWDS